MARFLAVLRAVGRASGRGARSLWQVSGNNMFYAGATLAFMMDPAVMGVFLVLFVLVLFIPSSGDPMAAVPADRLGLWPLAQWERRALRLASPLLNPVTWLVLAGLVWKRLEWGLWAFVAGLFLVGFAGSAVRLRMPPIAIPGRGWYRLTGKDLRQFLTALDVYCAMLLAVPAGYLRIKGELPADAAAPLTLMVVIILSTMALTLFGLDGPAGMGRYRLLPLRGWQILASKGIAYLALVFVVTLPLDPAAGLAGGLMALTAGQWHAVKQPLAQSRWRFRASRPFSASLTQMLFAIGGVAAVSQLGPALLVVCAAAWLVSVVWCGRALVASRGVTAEIRD